MKILITGSAGFIGFHLTKKLLERKNFHVIGIDNLNNYYDVKLKKARLKELLKHKNFNFFKINLNNKKKLDIIFKKFKFNMIINLAAQAGVRYSQKNPDQYINSNILGFYNLLETMKKNNVKKLLFASSSSVYGKINSKKFSENLVTDRQISLYATSKKINEIFMNFYGNVYDISNIGMRFFTVYGPYGRPDMSILRFIHWIYTGTEILLYGDGNQKRSFTYIDDVISGLNTLILSKDSGVFNIGSDKTVSLNQVISIIEKELNIESKIDYQPRAFKDVDVVIPDLNRMKSLNWNPTTSIEKGISKTIQWYLKYAEALKNIRFKFEYEK